MLRKYAYLLVGALFASMFITSCDEDDNPITGGGDITVNSVEIGDNTSIYAKEDGTITVNGVNFGNSEGEVLLSGGSLTNSESLTVTSWGDTQIEFVLPSPLADGLYEIAIRRTDLSETSFEIYVTAEDPELSSLVTVSVDSETVLVGWPMLGIEEWDQFDGYRVEYEQNGATETVTVEGNQVYINGLDASTAYEFTVYGLFVNDTRTNEVSRTWAPAERIPMSGGVPVLLFKSDNATLGSGLDIWDELSDGPRVLTVADGADWNFGIDTKTPGELYFGSAVNGLLEYNITADYPGELRFTSAGLTYTPADSLTTFDASPNQSLDNYDYQTDAVDLNSLDLGDSRGVMFVVKVPSAAGDNYARIFIPKDPADGDFLFVENNDEHVRLYISYQKTVGLPYAGN